MTESADKPVVAKAFKPVTFWLANPQLQLQIKVKGTRKLAKFSNGRFVAKTQAEFDAVKANGMAFEDDGFNEEAHPITGYKPGSAKAYIAHQKFIPQG